MKTLEFIKLNESGANNVGWPPAGAGGRLGLRLRPARPGRAGARAAAALPREIPHQGIRLRR